MDCNEMKVFLLIPSIDKEDDGTPSTVTPSVG